MVINLTTYDGPNVSMLPPSFKAIGFLFFRGFKRVFTIYRHGGYLDDVIQKPQTWKIRKKFIFNRPIGFGEYILKWRTKDGRRRRLR